MSDDTRFDELTRIWARPISRRRALRLSMGALFGGLVAATDVFNGRPAAAATACTIPSECPADQCCVNAPAFCIQMASGETCCGSPPRICAASDTCLNGACCPTASVCGSNCCGVGEACLGGTTCCPSGQACGSACCPQSKVCLNASTGTCGCPSGAPTCGNFCCQAGESCSDPTGGCCCPKGSTPCGRSCCKSGVACVDRANSICGCPSGTTPCGRGASTTCCPAGQACGSSGCTSPSNNTVPGYCSGISSDRNVKDHVVAVDWTRSTL